MFNLRNEAGKNSASLLFAEDSEVKSSCSNKFPISLSPCKAILMVAQLVEEMAWKGGGVLNFQLRKLIHILLVVGENRERRRRSILKETLKWLYCQWTWLFSAIHLPFTAEQRGEIIVDRKCASA